MTFNNFFIIFILSFISSLAIILGVSFAFIFVYKFYDDDILRSSLIWFFVLFFIFLLSGILKI